MLRIREAVPVRIRKSVFLFVFHTLKLVFLGRGNLLAFLNRLDWADLPGALIHSIWLTLSACLCKLGVVPSQNLRIREAVPVRARKRCGVQNIFLLVSKQKPASSTLPTCSWSAIFCVI